jgi:hypothetical protein
MAIIKPSLVFEGSHLGNRFDPDPGDYTARLVDVEFTNEGKSQVRMHWELTSHPPSGYSWRARHTCTLAQEYIGFLNKHLWCWKRKGWADLGEDDTERLDTLRSWIGDEANVRVEPWNSENPSSVTVTAVWSLGMSWPPFWADENEEVD